MNTKTYSSHTQRPQRVLMLTGIIAMVCLGLLFLALAASVNTKPYMPPMVAQKYMEEWLIESSRAVAGEVRLKHARAIEPDRKSTRLNSSHVRISYAVFCLKKKKKKKYKC